MNILSSSESIPFRSHLISRNEGKIKSYESCLDVRAWSHDAEDRNRYLRAWIKSNMPFCVISSSTLAVSLRIMGCRNRGRLTPRCHPNCKSKVVLESICTSCHTIKQCLQNDPKYEKYFEQEELETSHWPCDRCLEALKSIKMFWRIILEKVFRFNIPKSEKLPISTRNDNVQHTAKTWQTDILQEALYVKKMMPLIDQSENINTKLQEHSLIMAPHKVSTTQTKDGSTCTSSRNDNFEISDMTRIPEIMKINKPRKVSRSISVRIKKFDVGCETFGDGDNDAYINNWCELQQRFTEQGADVERLQRENLSLKIELQNVYCGFPIETHICAPSASLPTHDALAFLPKPFDDEPSDRLVDDVDSEMIITMKNCRNSKFKQVSLLQVLHKTNQPFYDNGTDASCRREDPINVLSKIQTTVGAIVQREISLVGKQRSENSPSDVKAFYHNLKIRKSSNKVGSKSRVASVTECDCNKKVEK